LCEYTELFVASCMRDRPFVHFVRVMPADGTPGRLWSHHPVLGSGPQYTGGTISLLLQPNANTNERNTPHPTNHSYCASQLPPSASIHRALPSFEAPVCVRSSPRIEESKPHSSSAIRSTPPSHAPEYPVAGPNDPRRSRQVTKLPLEG